MSVMERRLQLLLDRDRFERVQDEATRSGRSVAAVIREAIDVRFSTEDDANRRASLSLFLEGTEGRDDEPGESWADIKASLEEDLAARYPQ